MLPCPLVSAPGSEEVRPTREAGPAGGNDDGDGGTDAPTRFGKYKLHRLIARGGMGEVYLASLTGELGFEKRLVIKTILPEFAAQPRFIELFAAEAKTAVALSHGNIVPIYELGRADETFYIVMGYVDGPSVAQLLAAYRRRQQPGDPAVALHIVRGVLTGLAYAHTDEPGRQAVVHRDITPRNVLLDRSGQVRIVDFGIALPANVQVNLRAGSTGYMAPEQARAEAADPRADVFSTACLLYELLTHRPAFPREGVWMMPALDDVPEDLRDALCSALATDPDDRPSDAGALLSLLAPAMARHAGTFGDPSLAAHLREVFPDGWEHDPDEPTATGGATPMTKVAPKTHTFATRLTDVEPVESANDGGVDEDASDPTAADKSGASLAHRSITAAASLRATSPGASAQGVALPRPWPWRSVLFGAAAAAVVLLIALPRMTADPAPAPPPPEAAGAAPDDASAEAEAEPRPSQPDGEADATETPPTPPSPPGAVRTHTLRVEPPEAEVVVDGRTLQGSSPHTLQTEADASVQIAVRLDGYRPYTAVWSADAALPAVVRLRKDEPKGSGFLVVTAPGVSWADVFIDGKKRGTTPFRKTQVPAGKHRIEVRCTAACPSPQVLLKKTIEIIPNETKTLEAN